MADEENFNHCLISPCFAPECLVLQGFQEIIKCIVFILAKYGKMEQVVTTC